MKYEACVSAFYISEATFLKYKKIEPRILGLDKRSLKWKISPSFKYVSLDHFHLEWLFKWNHRLNTLSSCRHSTHRLSSKPLFHLRLVTFSSDFQSETLGCLHSSWNSLPTAINPQSQSHRDSVVPPHPLLLWTLTAHPCGSIRIVDSLLLLLFTQITTHHSILFSWHWLPVQVHIHFKTLVRTYQATHAALLQPHTDILNCFNTHVTSCRNIQELELLGDGVEGPLDVVFLHNVTFLSSGRALSYI